MLDNSFNYKKFEEYIKTNNPKLWEDVAGQSNHDYKKDFQNNEIHAINYLNENRLNLNFRQVFI